MELLIIDKDTRIAKEIITTSIFIQYTDDFYGEGSFTIQMSNLDKSMPYIVRGNYIVFEKGIVGIIKFIRDSQDEEREIIVSGFLTNHILSYRSVQKTVRKKDGITNIARFLVDSNFISANDARRKIDYVKLSNDEKYIPTSEKINFCDTGSNIRESISTMFLPYNYGFCLYPNIVDTSEDNINNLKDLEFRVLKPVDRTIGNKEGNSPIVFSFQFGNLYRLEYEEDGRDYASIAIVASEGTGEARKIIEVGEEEKIGIDRIELYVDARDIQSTTEDGETLTDEELKELMIQRGLEKLEDAKLFISFNASLIENKFKYGYDFNNGDFVSVIDENYNKIYDLQITSITKSKTKDSEYFDIKVGFDKLSSESIMSKTITSEKQSEDFSQDIHEINESLNGFTFGYTNDGKPGYKEAGADTFVPFSQGGGGESSDDEFLAKILEGEITY